MVRWSWLVLGGLAACMAISFLPHANAQAIVDNGVIRIGLDESGTLGVVGSDYPAVNCSYSSSFTSLQSVDNGYDAEDCDREGEGWGLSYGTGDDTDTWGKAYYQYNSLNIGGDVTPVSFTSTATTIKSVVMVGTDVELSQSWAPTKNTSYLYGDKIEITNKGMNTIPLIMFRRVMTWSDPTSGSDFSCVTLETVNGATLPANSALNYTGIVLASNDPNPLKPRSLYGTPYDGPPTGSDPQNYCSDIGSEWEFHFEEVEPRETVAVTLWYGGSPSIDDSMTALKSVKAIVASIDMNQGDQTGGTPWNWVMAFGNIPPSKGNHTKISKTSQPHTPKPTPSYDPEPELGTPQGQHPINLAPQFQAIPHVTTEYGKLVRFHVVADDQEADTLEYSAPVLPVGAYVEPDPNGGLNFIWTPQQGDVGTHCGITFVVREYLVDAKDAHYGDHNFYTQAGTGETCVNVFDRVGDSDLDGVRDSGDNCPGDKNYDQVDGDQDTIGNACDNCPDIYNPDQADTDGDLIGDACEVHTVVPPTGSANSQAKADTDGDSVPDVRDNCPGVPNLDQSDLDLDGTGDVCDIDADGDGVLNYAASKTVILDNCPDVANPEQKDSNGDRVGDSCAGGQVHPVKGFLTVTAKAPTPASKAQVKANAPQGLPAKKASAVPVLGLLAGVVAAVLVSRRRA